MKAPAPYGLTVIESCLNCVMHEEGLFCQLSPDSLRELNSIRQSTFYPEGAVLFVEGEAPRGVFILCSGHAKLVAGSKDGRNLTLRQVEAGEVLGLSSVISGSAYPVSAEIVTASQVSFIPGEPFMRFLQNQPDVSVRVAQHLSMELHKAWEQSRLLALAPSATAKLAQLLLAWADEHGKVTPEGRRFSLNITQDEIGQNIGATRETVSRLLADFRRRGLIRVKGGSVLLLQPAELRTLSGS